MASIAVQSANLSQNTADLLVTLDDNSTVQMSVTINPPNRNPVVSQIISVVKASGAQTKPQIKAAIEGATYDFSQGLF